LASALKESSITTWSSRAEIEIRLGTRSLTTNGQRSAKSWNDGSRRGISIKAVLPKLRWPRWWKNAVPAVGR